MRDIGLYYYGARYYDQGLGRFITPDSITPGLDSQALNPYSYCENNPVSLTDPTGNYPINNIGNQRDPGWDPGHELHRGSGDRDAWHDAGAAGLVKSFPTKFGPGLRPYSFSYDWGLRKFFNKSSLSSGIKAGLNLGRVAIGAVATVLLNPEMLGDDDTINGHTSNEILFQQNSANESAYRNFKKIADERRIVFDTLYRGLTMVDAHEYDSLGYINSKMVRESGFNKACQLLVFGSLEYIMAVHSRGFGEEMDPLISVSERKSVAETFASGLWGSDRVAVIVTPRAFPNILSTHFYEYEWVIPVRILNSEIVRVYELRTPPPQH
jgi:RHS repeat-associated protein